MKKYKISIIIPVFQEEKGVGDAVQTIFSLLKKEGIEHDFILVDDGSNDNSWLEIQALNRSYPNVNAIQLSRNFGKEAALCAGLAEMKTDACVVIDCDLQHPPELIPIMVQKWQEGFDIVEGIKRSRGRETFFHKLCANAFYRMLEMLSGFHLENNSDFKLLDAKVVATWCSLQERNTFFKGMIHWVGYKKAQLPFYVQERTKGTTKWSKMGLIKLALNALSSFSSLPLQLVTLIGALFMVAAVALTIDTFYNFFSGRAVDGFTTVILLLIFIGSMIMFSLGIIGTYIARIYEEVKHRPRYIVSNTLKSQN